MKINNACSQYSTIILSAGLSIRMKQCKQILPWGNTTILGRIIDVFQKCSIGEIVVVSGGYRSEVEAEVKKFGVNTIFNEKFENGEMVDSVKKGLSTIDETVDGVFIALGDQPMITSEDIIGMVNQHQSNKDKLVIPSYTWRRGHPWLIPQKFVPELLEIQVPKTLRDFINLHTEDISYYPVKSSNILADLDSPEEYERIKPKPN